MARWAHGLCTVLTCLVLGSRACPASPPESGPTPTQYDLSLVEIFSRTQDTEPVYQAVTVAVASLPSQVKQTLAQAGIRWKVVPTLVDYDPSLGQMQARGWGHDFRYVAGTYSKKHNEVLIAERALNTKDSRMALRGHRLHTTLHETGHAYDWALSRFSTTAQFRAAYQEDVRGLRDQQRQSLRYYLQAQDAGPAETFAELFAEGVSRKASLPPEQREIVQSFPSSFEVVLGLLK